MDATGQRDFVGVCSLRSHARIIPVSRMCTNTLSPGLFPQRSSCSGPRCVWPTPVRWPRTWSCTAQRSSRSSPCLTPTGQPLLRVKVQSPSLALNISLIPKNALYAVCSTGSSLMPQKKNADSLELIRSKAGRVFGRVRRTQLVGLFPFTYVSAFWCQLTSFGPFIIIIYGFRGHPACILFPPTLVRYMIYVCQRVRISTWNWMRVSVFKPGPWSALLYSSVQDSWWLSRVCPAPTTRTCRYNRAYLEDMYVNLYISVLSYLRVSSLVCFCAIRVQEDKEAMFDCYDTIHAVLQVATGVMSTLEVRSERLLNVWNPGKLNWCHRFD